MPYSLPGKMADSASSMIFKQWSATAWAHTFIKPPPPSCRLKKNELSILQNNQNSLASCVGIESLCEHAKPGIWVEHAKFLQHKDTGKLLVLSLDYLENNDTAKTLHNRYSASLLPQADRKEAWHYAWRTFLSSIMFLMVVNLTPMIFALFEQKTTSA